MGGVAVAINIVDVDAMQVIGPRGGADVGWQRGEEKKKEKICICI